jgi:hypothetical protein
MEPSESKRVYEELLRDTRPVVDMARDQYAVYLAQFGGDDEKAFHAMVAWFDNLKISGANEKTYVALCAFMARRLQYHVPRLVGSMN